MTELQPFQADHSKLKKDFCTTAESAFCCENFTAILHSAVEFLLNFPDICYTLEAKHRELKANFAAL